MKTPVHHDNICVGCCQLGNLASCCTRQEQNCAGRLQVFWCPQDDILWNHRNILEVRASIRPFLIPATYLLQKLACSLCLILPLLRDNQWYDWDLCSWCEYGLNGHCEKGEAMEGERHFLQTITNDTVIYQCWRRTWMSATPRTGTAAPRAGTTTRSQTGRGVAPPRSVTTHYSHNYLIIASVISGHFR